MILVLEVMGKEETKRTVLDIARKRPAKSAPAVLGASRRVLLYMCSLKVNLVLKVI